MPCCAALAQGDEPQAPSFLRVVRPAMRRLRSLLHSGPEVGPAMTPYYRRLLPVLNLYWRNQRNLGDRTDYAQQKQNDLGATIQQTVELMEKTGSPDASMWIKYHIPTYESCVR